LAHAGVSRAPERTALVITLLYLGAGVLWVLFSDYLLLNLMGSARALTRVQSLKGVAFVVATASLLYPLLRQSYRTRRPRQRLRGQDDSRAWLERASEPMLMFDRAGRLLEVNSLACAAFGYGAPELLRVGAQFLVAPNDPPPVPWADLRDDGRTLTHASWLPCARPRSGALRARTRPTPRLRSGSRCPRHPRPRPPPRPLPRRRPTIPPCGAPRGWRRSADWPAELRTTSTTCSPPSSDTETWRGAASRTITRRGATWTRS
jgi:PAS domain-containing protein